MRRVVDRIGQFARPARSRRPDEPCDRRSSPATRVSRPRSTRKKCDGAFDAGLEVQRLAVGGPAQRGRNQIETVGGEPRRAAAGGDEPDLRMRAFLGIGADERDRLAVRRPARRAVCARDDPKSSSASRPFASMTQTSRVVPLVERLARAIRNERDLLPVGRPLRIGVVPVVAGGDLGRRVRTRCRRPRGGRACRRTSRCR